MMQVSIKPALVVTGKAGEHLEPQLFPLLRAIQDEGKLTSATRRVQLSYRYAWNLLEKWAALFGDSLVRMERGKGAELTALGRKFLWAEERIAASLFPRLQEIALELNAEIRKSRSRPSPSLRVHASHGYAVARLPELMRELGETEVELRYMSSAEALASVSRGHCDLAGFHLPVDAILARTVWKSYAAWVRPREHRIIRMLTRQQGLILARRNPLKIRSLADLVRRDVRFVNRQPGSGTRLLLDGLLRAEGIDPRKIRGYDSGEFTHAAVAAFVASGAANVGLGVEPAARQFGLDFIPVATEQYMLACSAKTLTLRPTKQFLGILSGAAFGEMVRTIPGCELDAPGTVCTFEEAVPWLRWPSKGRAADVEGQRIARRRQTPARRSSAATR